MELEIELKITQNRDDHISTVDLRIAKDRAGPVFLSRETETMFILTAHLKGYRRDMIEIEINEDGTRIAIIGKKPVQEMVMMGWIMLKKELEIRGFRKVFRIPDGVNLDRIKAKFNEGSILTIVMPKLVKGVRGVGIEEVKEEESDRGRPETTPIVAEVPERESTGEKVQEESKEPEVNKVEDIDQVVVKEVDKKGPETTQIVADEVLEKDGIGETEKEDTKLLRIKSIAEGGQVEEALVDKRQLEATKVAAEEPKVESMEETAQVGGKKIDRGGSKPMQIEADKVPASEDIAETLQKESKEPEIEETQEIDQVVETSQEKEVIKSQKELDDAAPVKVESSAMTAAHPQTEIKETQEIDQVVETSQEKQVIESRRELNDAAPVKVESLAMTAAHPQAATLERKKVEPERKIDQPQRAEMPPTGETWGEELLDSKVQTKTTPEEQPWSEELLESKPQTTRQTTPEEPWRQELLDSKEQRKEQTIPEAERVRREDGTEESVPVPESIESMKTVEDQAIQQSELPNQPSAQQTQVEAKQIKEEIGQAKGEMPQEPQQQEADIEVQETTMSKPDEEKISHPVHSEDQHKTAEEVHRQEESREVGNEIQVTDQSKLPEENEFAEIKSLEVEKHKGLVEGATQKKQPVSEKSNKLTPLVVAGSALLASLIALVMHFIRAKKRKIT